MAEIYAVKIRFGLNETIYHDERCMYFNSKTARDNYVDWFKKELESDIYYIKSIPRGTEFGKTKWLQPCRKRNELPEIPEIYYVKFELGEDDHHFHVDTYHYFDSEAKMEEDYRYMHELCGTDPGHYQPTAKGKAYFNAQGILCPSTTPRQREYGKFEMNIDIHHS